MNRGQYSTKRRKRKGYLIAVILVILGVAAYAAAETAAAAAKGPEPDAVYPMTNVNISWSQTFHAGSWGE